MNNEILKIIKIFSFNKKEKEIFDFLNEYENKIKDWLKENNFNKEQLLRFMIVGLYPYYRAYNHRGEDFTTIIENRNTSNNIEVFVIFNSYYNNQIKDTEEYLNLLTLDEKLEISPEDFFNFVVYNKKIG